MIQHADICSGSYLYLLIIKLACSKSVWEEQKIQRNMKKKKKTTPPIYNYPDICYFVTLSFKQFFTIRNTIEIKIKTSVLDMHEISDKCEKITGYFANKYLDFFIIISTFFGFFNLFRVGFSSPTIHLNHLGSFNNRLN